MPTKFHVVDLFAGPGGLAEGFSSLSVDRSHPFEVALSVEKEGSAFATLRLRSFVRQFNGAIPQDYYDYVAGKMAKETLIGRYPAEWEKACEETLLAELGTPEAEQEINRRLDKIKRGAGDMTILVGGPPCQAYSLVGRARNRGVADYVPSKDKRHFLYREYIRILDRLNPMAFVMENVKGMLSSSVKGRSIFAQVLEDLRHAGGVSDRYTILSLTPETRSNPFVLRAEDHGIPQTRHRVILVGIRSDLAQGLDGDERLQRRNYVPAVEDVLRGLPELRSGLSRIADSDEAWRMVIREAYQTAARATADDGQLETSKKLEELAQNVRSLKRQSALAPKPPANEELADWLYDEKLQVVPNHCSRGHMAPDLARYAFAAAFAEVNQRSPRAEDFPTALAPAHKSWASNKFNDRFRIQLWCRPASTITSHIAKDGHYFIHPDPSQCRSLTVREAARLQTFPDNYFFEGNRTQQYVQVGNAVPPLLARHIAEIVHAKLTVPRIGRKIGGNIAADFSEIAA